MLPCKPSVLCSAPAHLKPLYRELENPVDGAACPGNKDALRQRSPGQAVRRQGPSVLPPACGHTSLPGTGESGSRAPPCPPQPLPAQCTPPRPPGLHPLQRQLGDWLVSPTRQFKKVFMICKNLPRCHSDMPWVFQLLPNAFRPVSCSRKDTESFRFLFILCN